MAGQPNAWNQMWHVPTAHNPLTGKVFVAPAANEFGVQPRHWVLSRPMLRIAGWFDPLVAEFYEMLYQSDRPYLSIPASSPEFSALPVLRTLTAFATLPPHSRGKHADRSLKVAKYF